MLVEVLFIITAAPPSPPPPSPQRKYAWSKTVGYFLWSLILRKKTMPSDSSSLSPYLASVTAFRASLTPRSLVMCAAEVDLAWQSARLRFLHA